ncbi:ABC transporter substrate-binding protein/permease [Holzapfeliella sp. He02]|uniref:ABC transporter substrate-binding protein/permease n=1 Tax=Holzapfeliella saturejae TaxID=3082953 RepID=A0ABU8SG79_9LACO
MKKSIVAILAAIVSVISIALVTPQHASVNAAEKKVYQIGTDVTFPPFEFANSTDGQYVGIDIDLMKAIAEEEGFEVKILPLGFSAAVQALDTGQVDGMIAGTTITNERKNKMDFSTPYYHSGIVFASAKGSEIKSIEDAKGKRVAVKTGTSGAKYATENAEKYGYQIVNFDDSNSMYQDVITGNSAGVFEDMSVVSYAINQGTALQIASETLSNDPYGFSVKKGQNQDLLNAFNQGLEKLKQNGTYDQIVAKYVGEEAMNNQRQQKSDESSWSGLLKVNGSSLMEGLKQTMILTVMAIFFATIFGIIFGLMGVVPSKILNGISTTVIYIFRGLPLLVLALFIYTGIPSLTGVRIPAVVAGIITLMFNEGAYTAAFIAGGIKSVDKGQMEAARSLGLPFGKAMRRVVLPQGIKLIIPSFINQFIITLKDTSILSIIGLVELTQTGKIIIARNLEGFKVWAIIALIYLVIITLLTWASKYVERRLNK